MTIWKYTLPSRGKAELEMPDGARLLTVQNQSEHIVLWAVVDDRKPKQTRRFDVRPTGTCWATFSGLNYVGTVQLLEGAYVAHVFEVID